MNEAVVVMDLPCLEEHVHNSARVFVQAYYFDNVVSVWLQLGLYEQSHCRLTEAKYQRLRRLEADDFHGLGLHLDQHPTDIEVAFAHWAHHFEYAVHTQHDLLDHHQVTETSSS